MKNILKIFRSLVGSILILMLAFSPLTSSIKVENCEMECHVSQQTTTMKSACCAKDIVARGGTLSAAACAQEMKHNFELTEIEQPKSVNPAKVNDHLKYLVTSSPLLYDDTSSEILSSSVSNSHINSAPIFILNSAFLS